MFEPCHYRVSIKGIVVDESGRFLLAKEDTGIWEILGGGLEHEEDPIEALHREILEECGLEVTWVSPTPKYLITAIRPSNEGYTANVIYEVKFANLEFIPSDECQELRLFSLEEAQKLDVFPNVAKFLEVFDPTLHGVASGTSAN